jgi:hypothetical protein
MRRRRALQLGTACAAAWVALPLPKRAAASDAGGGGLWVWGDDRLWWIDPQRRLGPRPTVARSTACTPVAVAGGLWALGEPDRLTFHPRPEPAAARLPPPWETKLPTRVDAFGASADGRWAVAAAGTRLHLIDRLGADGLDHPAQDLFGRSLGQARRVRAIAGRRSVLVDWGVGGQWWELSLDPQAEPIFDGLVHDHRMGEAIARPGWRWPRRLPLAAPPAAPPELHCTWHDRPWALARDGSDALVVHLDVRRAVLRVPLEPSVAVRGDLSAAAAGSTLWLANGSRLHRIDTRRWRLGETTALPGPAQELRAHEWPAPWALVEGRWWHAAAGTVRWLPVPGLPAGVQAVADEGTSDAALAFIGEAPGDRAPRLHVVDGHARPAPGMAGDGIELPAEPGRWRGLALQPG